MRYSLRTPSPSPERSQRKHGFRVALDESSDEEDFTAISSGSEIESGLSASDMEASPAAKRRRSPRKRSGIVAARSPIASPSKPTPSAEELWKQRELEEALAAIRLRTQHQDPYEEWEKNVRKESFKAARQTYATKQNELEEQRTRIAAKDLEARKAAHDAQTREVQQILAAARNHQDRRREQLAASLKAREQDLWRRVDEAIALDTKKVETKLAAERQVREEQERKQKEEETRRRLEAEKKMAEEQKKRDEAEKKKKEEAEKKRLEDEEAKKEKDEAERVEAEKKAKLAKVSAEKDVRQQLGQTIAHDDWVSARQFLQRLKTEVMPVVKNKNGDSAQLKSIWGTHRRQINPKIGQLTNDAEQISKVTLQLVQIVRPLGNPHHEIVYYGLLSSLAKAILVQAETEVGTASDQATAVPIAQVAFNLLEQLDGFHEVLWARIVGRTGGWVVPLMVGQTDWDGRKWNNLDERKKAMGMRKRSEDDWETSDEYNARMTGIMRVYFTILAIRPPRQPLQGPMWQTPMIWKWLARLLGSDGGGQAMLRRSVAVDILASGIQVFGVAAKGIWGNQFVKILALIYEGATTGFEGGEGPMGGSTPEAGAARSRLRFEIENVMNSS